jgi:hypothetical protein
MTEHPHVLIFDRTEFRLPLTVNERAELWRRCASMIDRLNSAGWEALAERIEVGMADDTTPGQAVPWIRYNLRKAVEDRCKAIRKDPHAFRSDDDVQTDRLRAWADELPAVFNEDGTEHPA